MYEENDNVVLPDSLQKDMLIHEIFICPDMIDARVLVMIHKMKENLVSHVVRVYMMKRENNQFIVDVELEAFAFSTHKDAIAFADRLSGLTAFELLMIQNGYDFTMGNRRPLQ
ncbi:hypothetical protein ACXYMX_15455 [Sporosarcina sp. CAU 1771]